MKVFDHPKSKSLLLLSGALLLAAACNSAEHEEEPQTGDPAGERADAIPRDAPAIKESEDLDKEPPPDELEIAYKRRMAQLDDTINGLEKRVNELGDEASTEYKEALAEAKRLRRVASKNLEAFDEAVDAEAEEARAAAREAVGSALNALDETVSDLKSRFDEGPAKE